MAGRLIYLMGPSGSGKDTVLQGLHARLGPQDFCIAQRIVTRAADSSEAGAMPVSAQEFERLEQSGALAMAWRAHGLAYGIARDIDDQLNSGYNVLVNGSRAYLPQARGRYASLFAVLLTVKPDILEHRLRTRGRENSAQIQARLARNASCESPSLACDPQSSSGIFMIDNSGPPEQAIQILAACLQRVQLCA